MRMLLFFLIFTLDLAQNSSLFAQSIKQKSWLATHGIEYTGSFSEKDEKTLIRLIALKESYPEKIKSIRYQDNGGWFLTFYEGSVLFWADGRLLPLSKVARQEQYASYFGYGYEEKIPDPKQYSKEKIARLKEITKQGSKRNTQVQETTYFRLMYGPLNDREMRQNTVVTTWMGFRFNTNRLIIPALKRVESRLQKTADGTTRAFFKSLHSVGSYNWRVIGGAKKYSYHSFGTAIDLLPRSRAKAIFWGWTKDYTEDWPIIPLKDRWQIPDKIVKALEDEGFIWGGKWTLYDIMHFEYRPELRKAYLYQQEYEALADQHNT